MTNNELLDAILHVYLWGWKLKQENDPRHRKIKFDFIVRSQLPTIEPWRIEFLRKQLFDDGFLEHSKYGDGEPYELTPAGVKAAQTSWYKKQATDRQTDDEIKQQTLADLKRSRYSLIIAILAFIIPTLISVYTLWSGKQQPTTEEVQDLQQRIEKLESSKTEAKTTSIVSTTTLADTLKKESRNK